jgi:HEAT repeat protein
LRAKLVETRLGEERASIAIGLGLMYDRQSIETLTDIVRVSKYQPEFLSRLATSLAVLNDKELVPELAAMLAKAPGLSSQSSIATALGRVGDVRAIDALIALLEDRAKTEHARAFAADALGTLADRHAIPLTTQYGIGANYLAFTSSLSDSEDLDGLLDSR